MRYFSAPHHSEILTLFRYNQTVLPLQKISWEQKCRIVTDEACWELEKLWEEIFDVKTCDQLVNRLNATFLLPACLSFIIWFCPRSTNSLDVKESRRYFLRLSTKGRKSWVSGNIFRQTTPLRTQHRIFRYVCVGAGSSLKITEVIYRKTVTNFYKRSNQIIRMRVESKTSSRSIFSLFSSCSLYERIFLCMKEEERENASGSDFAFDSRPDDLVRSFVKIGHGFSINYFCF